MSDFVSETFDSSIVEKHNDYSAESKKLNINLHLYHHYLIMSMLNQIYMMEYMSYIKME